MNGPNPIDFPDYMAKYQEKVSELTHENITLTLKVQKLTEYAAYLQEELRKKEGA